MKKLISLLLLSLSAICLFAQHRSESEALKIAESFFNQTPRKAKRLTSVSQTNVRNQIRKRMPSPQTTIPNNSFYIINDETNNRFVIVSADERFYEILGYSNNGCFEAEQVPSALLGLLNSYNDQYDYMLRYEPNVPRVRVRKTSFPAVEPLISTKWGQGEPYNDICPYDVKKEKHCVTGCVATAMAQVMNYHKHPLRGKGSFSYNAKLDSTQIVPISMDFSTIEFNWNNMLDEYKNGAGTAEQRAEVAQLMHACGVSVAMQYKANESGAYEYDIAYALTHYFGYNPNLLYKEKDYYSEEEWDAMILEDLIEKRPILYAGDAGLFFGHSFILDGCAEDGTYHFNFGWEGSSDGNFYLQGTDKLLHYSNGQSMVYHVTPLEYGKAEDVFYASSFESQKTKLKLGKTSQFDFWASCYSSKTSHHLEEIEDKFEGEVGIGLYDNNFNFVKPLYQQPFSSKDFYSVSVRAELQFDTNTFQNGHEYIIAPYAKGNESTEATRIRTKGTEEDYYVAKVENDSVNLWMRGTEFYYIPLGTYIVSATNAKGETINWYATLSKEGETDYEYTLTNLEPNVTPKDGRLFNIFDFKTDASGKLLNIKNSTLKDNITLKSYTNESLKLSYNTDQRTISIDGEWGSIQTTKDGDQKVITELTRYANTKLTFVSPEEMKVIAHNNSAGELMSHFPNTDQYFINTLVVSGQLNGTDIKAIRDLIINGSLAYLDLTEASIVEGGENYFENSYKNYATTKDIIGGYMFSGCKKLLSIKLPTNLTAIDEYAFSDCSGIVDLVIPEGVTNIANMAFYDCNRLTRLSIPSTIRYISDYSLDGCEAVEDIYCSTLNIEKIKNSSYGESGELRVFSHIPSGCLWHIVNGQNKKYMMSSWWNPTWNIIEDQPQPYNETINVENNIAGNLASHIPDRLTNYITDITISGQLNGTDIKQIRSMLQDGFLTNLNLQEASIVPGGGAYHSGWSSDYFTKVDTIGEYMFSDSEFLSTIILPKRTKAIEDYAFYNCKKLNAIDIPEGIQALESSVLSGCSKLTTISLPSSLVRLDDYALKGCSSLSTISWPTLLIEMIKSSSYGTAGDLQAFKDIKDDCTWHVVKGMAEQFRNQSWWNTNWIIIDDLEKPYNDSIIITDNIAGELASRIPLGHLYLITNMTISGALNGTDIKLIRSMLQDGILTTLDLQDASIVSGGEAYYNGWSSDYFTKADTIGEHIFSESEFLSTIILPKRTKAIEDYAFYDCKTLKAIDIPEGIQALESSVLSGCSSLTTISLPSSLIRLNDYALSGCNSLNTISWPTLLIEKIKPSSYGTAGDLQAFKDIKDDCTWHVVKGMSEQFRNQSWWNTSWTIIDDLEKPYDDSIIIKDNVAGDLSSHVPEKLKNLITLMAVSGQLNGTDIKMIREMIIDGSLTTLNLHDASIVTGGEPYYTSWTDSHFTQDGVIGKNMFYNCKLLKNISLPESISSIEEYAFYNCVSLDSISIPEGILHLGNRTFSGCSSLSTICIPSTVSFIHDYSFSGCTSINTVYCSILDIGKIKASDASYFKEGDLQAFSNFMPDCIWHVAIGTAETYRSQSWWISTWTIIDDLPVPDAITPIRQNANTNSTWHTLQGTRLNHKPTQRGIYIVNGKKVLK